MDVRLHRSLTDFRALAEPLYRRDPVLHTVELTALRDPPPSDTEHGALLLTVWNDGTPIGAAMQAQQFPLLCNGIPVEAAAAVAAELARARPRLPGVRGLRETASAFTAAWCAETGHTGRMHTEERLYRLATLRAPDVTGTHREAVDDDSGRLVEWLDGFFADAGDEPPNPAARERFVSTAHRLGDRFVLWALDDGPVSMAMVRAPASGVSRIGPVYTPPARRGHGYGSAVTAAAADLARRSGVAEVVLFADLANPVANAIYQRIGFEPVCESVRIDIRVP